MLYRSYSKSQLAPGQSTTVITTRLGDIFSVDLSSYLEWHLWAFGGYEEYLSGLFDRLVRRGDCCVDVGANMGLHSVRLAKLVGSDGHVIALEPDQELARKADGNVRLNGLANVRVIQAAASDQSGGTATLYRPGREDRNKGRASLLKHDYLTGTSALVPTVTIDAAVRRAVAFIKIDVEGHEATVLSGAAAIIEAWHPSVIFEYNPEFIRNTSANAIKWLLEREYKLYALQKRQRLIMSKGKTKLSSCRCEPAENANILAIHPSNTSQLDSLLHEC